MTLALLILLLVIQVLTMCWVLYVIRELLMLHTVPPFLKTRRSALAHIAESIGELPEGTHLFDLGSGDGAVLRAIHSKNPHARYTGIEMRLFPYMLARSRTAQGAPIEYIRGNIYSTDLSSATHIYTYLYPNVMEKLAPQLQSQLRPGTMLYSLDFPFKDIPYIEAVSLEGGGRRSLAKTLYIYRF